MQSLNFRILLITCIFLLLITGNKAISQTPSICINEFMASNTSTLADEDGDYSDWIEIYNPTPYNIDLANWSLTDDKRQIRKWLFPAVTLKKGCYIVVYASGKNRKIAGDELHTNFNLNRNGEYLALYSSSENKMTEFSPFFKSMTADVSHGLWKGEYKDFTVPTPGKDNDPSTGTLPSVPVFSKKHGFYDVPFTLEIYVADPAVKIYYTTNGSFPGVAKGILYSAPISISGTSTIRAVCVKDNQQFGSTVTQTYLFTEDIIRQKNNPAGYPSTWGPFLSIPGTAPADYEMDPEMMADPQFASSVKEALRDLPVISLVTDRNYFFSKTVSADTGGIYIYTGTAQGRGYNWERPVSLEYFDDSESVSLQVNCGIEIQGGEGRRPEKSPKHSFLLKFKSEYGAPKLNFPLFGDNAAQEFNNLILRAGFGNTWIHWSTSERAMAQYLRDRWTKDTFHDMGHPSSHGIFVHLFINGLYWGLYNPSERMDSGFAEAYLGGKDSDFDVIKDYAEAVDGSIAAWNTAISLANAGLADNTSYQRIRGNRPDGTRDPSIEPLVDAVSLADYMILNFYGGNWDWDHHNWVAIRNRVNPKSGFQFFCWDAEHMVEGVTSNLLTENNDKCPSRIFQKMRLNAEFRRMFADRVQKFCLNNGELTPESAAGRWNMRAGEIDKAINAESARWGDYRRDVHRWQTGPYELYTRETFWVPQKKYLLNTFFPGRTNIFLTHLRAAGLFPSINGPAFLINNKPVIQDKISSGSVLTMTCDNGTIYYTTDGSDPVIWNSVPVISPLANQYTGGLSLTESSHIKARVFHNNEWSATTEQFFVVPENFHDLKITEINYHPLPDASGDEAEYEFIEIKNTGSSVLNLGGIKLKEAINYEFSPGTQLLPRKFIVLASGVRSFYNRYGFLPFDEYKGQLNNTGELIIMVSAEKDTLCSIGYDDFKGWPSAADGTGKSLAPIEINPAGDQNNPGLWRQSYLIGGSPGADDVYVVPEGVTKELITVYPGYPNPFSEATKIRYTLNEEAFVQIVIMNSSGKTLATIEDSEKASGYYENEWKVPDLDNGLYLYRIVVHNAKGKNFFTGKLLHIK